MTACASWLLRHGAGFWGRLWIGLLLLLVGCGQRRTAESACLALRDAIWEADGIAVYDVLLQNTQWSVSTVNKLHRQMATQIRASYPAAQREAALGRLFASSADSGRELFLSLYGERYAADFRARVAEDMRTVPVVGDVVHCGCAAGKPFLLARGLDGKWGLSELDREWEDAKLRAFHDLETVEHNVELFQKVGSQTATFDREAGSR
ncbi:MAG: hypothetical protein U0787_20765 [Polyangia bacterium]